MSIRVSIVDDNKQLREILASLIQQVEGFTCVSCYPSMEDALEEMPAVKPSVVLMDINLPGLNGVEGVRQLKPLLPETQFVMLTVYEDTNHIFEALAAGASGYLLKRTPCLELLESLKDVHNGGSPMTSYIARKVMQAFRQTAKPSPGKNSPPSSPLTPREREVLELLTRGYLYKEIMQELKISRPTVNSHIRNIYEKLHVHSRSQDVAKFSHFHPVRFQCPAG